MNDLSRRKLIAAGLATAAGASGLAVANNLARRYGLIPNGLIPPDNAGPYGVGETLTYAAQRILTSHSMAREFPRSAISKPPFANEVAPFSARLDECEQKDREVPDRVQAPSTGRFR